MDLSEQIRRAVRDELARQSPLRKGAISAYDADTDSYIVAGRRMISAAPGTLSVGDVVVYSEGPQPVIVNGPLTGGLPAGTVVDPAPPVTSGVKVDADRFVMSFDPSDLSSIDERRRSGQLYVAGARFQVGATADDIGPDIESQFPGTYDLTGYDTVFSGSAVRSFEMVNGSDLRWGVVTAGGRPGLLTATQFTGAGYSPSNNDSPLSQLNLALTRGVGANDPIFADGSRCQWNLIEHPVTIGPSGTLIRWVTEIRGEAWMDAGDWTTCPFEVHAPGGGLSSPFLSQIINGELIWWSRDSGSTLDYNTATNSDAVAAELGRTQCPDPGSFLRLLYEMRIDPTGTNAVFNVYQVESNQTLRTLVSTDRPFGYWFGPTQTVDGELVNSSFYCIVHQLYGFHQYQPDEIGGHGNPPWNWSNDGGWGAARQLVSMFGGLSYNDEISLAELASHAVAFAPAD